MVAVARVLEGGGGGQGALELGELAAHLAIRCRTVKPTSEWLGSIVQVPGTMSVLKWCQR